MTLVSRTLVLAAMLALAACEMPRDSAFQNRGGPEALLDVSSEVVNLNIATPKDVNALSNWIAQDAPSRAELQCDVSKKNCKDALKVLEKRHVQIATVPSANNTVTLVYERILARDCNQRYKDASGATSNLYNAPPPSFGCAISANIVQHVSDKSEFVNPALSDNPSAVGAVMAIERSRVPVQSDQTYGLKNSLTGSNN